MVNPLKRLHDCWRSTHLVVLLGLLLGLSAQGEEALAKKRRKAKKVKIVESTVNPEVVKGAKSIFMALAGTSNGAARLAVIEGLIELGGADREEGLNQAEKASDFEIKLAGLEEILARPKMHRSRLKSAKAQVEKLFLSNKAQEHRVGKKVIDQIYKKRDRSEMWNKALKKGSAYAQNEARKHFIALGGKKAWSVLKTALKLSKDSEGYKLALQTLRDKQYPKAKSWALSHAGMKGEAGEVAQLWIDRVAGKEAAKITKGLYREYLKAAGNKKKQADFPRRVRLANMLSKRGMVKEVLNNFKFIRCQINIDLFITQTHCV